jgi:acetyl esterase/lipase
MNLIFLMTLFALAVTRLVAQPSRVIEHIRNQSQVRQASVELSYGNEDLQQLDYWKPRLTESPLVVFVHGGGWKSGDKAHAADTKAAYFLSQGYGFVSMNYRLVPNVKVEDQAHDVASAVAFLKKESSKLGFDARRIVLMGHSAGAHLVALVGTDPVYLKKVGLGMDAVRGIIALDGACYDVPRQFSTGAPIMQETYKEAFGTDNKRQVALSPTLQAAAPNVSSFLILHVQRVDGIAQSNALAEALKKAGITAQVQGFDGNGMLGHLEINRRLGEADYAATSAVEQWLRKLLRP